MQRGSENLSRSGLLDWHATSALEPASTRRRFGRPGQTAARPQRGQGPRGRWMTDTLVRRYASNVEQVAYVDPSVRKEVDREDASNNQGSAESLDSVNWRTYAGPCFGPGPLRSEVYPMGLPWLKG